MPVELNLVSLEAFTIVDPDGRDTVTMRVTIDHGATVSPTTGLTKGQKIGFDTFPDIQQISFDDQVRFTIYADEDFNGRQHKAGTIFISADEAGLGDRKQQFTGDGAHYELTYRVVRP